MEIYIRNFEPYAVAAKLLEKEIGTDKFKVTLTLSGAENRYARWLYKRWGNVRSIDFAGFMSKEKLYDTYAGTGLSAIPFAGRDMGACLSANLRHSANRCCLPTCHTLTRRLQVADGLPFSIRKSPKN